MATEKLVSGESPQLKDLRLDKWLLNTVMVVLLLTYTLNWAHGHMAFESTWTLLPAIFVGWVTFFCQFKWYWTRVFYAVPLWVVLYTWKIWLVVPV